MKLEDIDDVLKQNVSKDSYPYAVSLVQRLQKGKLCISNLRRELML